jgi:hypothetical protein
LLKLHDVAKTFLHFKVGDGSRIFFWHDKWHPACYLLDHYCPQTVHDSRINIDSKLSTIIKDGDWPYARSNSLVEIQCRLPEVTISGIDLPIWKSLNGRYSSCNHLGSFEDKATDC